MIGLLMLMGIVTKNAILLVDFAVEMMRAAWIASTAMVEAGRKRARPDHHDLDRDVGGHAALGDMASAKAASSARRWRSR
jgi:hypothetical protein